MKYVGRFRVTSDGLKKAIIKAKNFNKESCHEFIKGPDFQKLDQGFKYWFLLVLAAITLSGCGFNEIEVSKILENLLEIDPKSLSRGNLKDIQ